MKLLNIATESIAFQTGAFFKELTLLVQDLRAADVKDSQTIAKFFNRVDQCIYKHTGITVTSNVWPDSDNGLMLIPALTRGNVLHRASFADFLKENFHGDNVSFLNYEKKGWIDPATSRVGGAFSEIAFKMYLGDYFMFSKTFTAEEAAGVILHEVGHAYTFLQFIADTVITNCVLQRTYAELMNGNPDKKVKVILTKAADDMKMKGREWLEAVDGDTPGEIGFKILATAVAIEPRQMDNKRYFTQDAAEELAEIFAARHGAGRAILTMRSKFISQSRSYGILSGVGMALFGMAATVILPPAGILFFLIGACAAWSGAADASKAMDITKLKHEAMLMRNQFVERLKDSKLPKAEISEQVESINLADKIIQGYVGTFDPGMAVKFFDMFRRGKMDARASREYTDILESLAANDLFVRAAQLGLAGK